MKTKIVVIPTKKEITFYIGENAQDNMNVLSIGNESDIWFHAFQTSSCHVIASIPENHTKKEKSYIIKIGANLCKQFTKKLSRGNDIIINYTRLKNIVETDVVGMVQYVNIQDVRSIII